MIKLRDRFVGGGFDDKCTRDKNTLEESFDRAVLYIGERDLILFESNCCSALAGTEMVIRKVYTANGVLIYQASARLAEREYNGKAMFIVGRSLSDCQLSDFLRRGIIKIYKNLIDRCEWCERNLSYSPTMGSFCIDCGGDNVSEWLGFKKSSALHSLREKG